MGRHHASTLTRRLLVLALCASGPARLDGTRAQKAASADELAPGSAVQGDIAPGQTRTYQIALAAGQFSRITVQQRGIDLVEKVLTPDGELVARFDSAWDANGVDQVEFVAEASGTYRIEVSAKLKRAQCGFEIAAEPSRAATVGDRSLHESNRLTTKAADLLRAGKHDEAADAARRALDAAEKMPGPIHANSARSLQVLGDAQRELGDYAGAEASFTRALAISEKAYAPDHPMTAEALGRLGSLYGIKEEYAKAARMLEQAAAISERALGADHPEFLTSLSTLASFHLQIADFVQAEREMDRALAGLERTRPPNDGETARVLNNLGNLYLLKKDYDRAESVEQRALTMYEALDGPEHPSIVYPLLNLGRIAHERPTGRDLDRALAMYTRALTVLEKSSGPKHLNVGILLNNIANVYKAKQDYDTPLKLYQRALEIGETSGSAYHGLTIFALGNIANLYVIRGDLANWIEYQHRVDERLERALALNLAIGSERQKLAYFRSYAERTERTISLHLRLAPQDSRAAALAALVLLQRKGRILDAVAGNLTALRQRFDPADRELLDRLNATTAELAKLALNGAPRTGGDDYRRRLAALEEQNEQLEARMSERRAEFRAQTQTVSLAAVQAAIPPQAALVEFVVYRPFDPLVQANANQYGPPRYAVCVMRGDGHIQWTDLGAAREIDAAVDQLRRALRDPARDDVRELARIVDERVMRPVRPMIAGVDHLLVSPDGELNLVPFDALVDEDGRYLVERYAFTYLTSGRDLLRLQVPRASRNGPVVIADPSFGERSNAAAGTDRQGVTNANDLSGVYFTRLSGAAQESEALKRLFPDAQVYIRGDATESNLRRVDAPSILHIATHGFFVANAGAASPPTTENPLLRTGLALAGANARRSGDDDGIVTALEASGLNLWGTKLVTLSACDSGVGEVKNGEGVYGLRRAFLLAGTETLVMSLWPVSDYVTRELMTAYYAGLKRGTGRGQALRDVQLEALKRKGREHPFYWASFIQSGEWADLRGRRN